MSRIRPRRVESLIREEVAGLFLAGRIHDPRIQGRVTVTDVEVSADLRHAKIFVSVLGSPEQEQAAVEGLASATGFVQGCLAKALSLRFAPKVVFVRDDSIERGVKLVQKINSLVQKGESDAG